MSTLKVTNIESPSGGGVNAKITDINGGQLSNRNLIINGAMRVAQRATSKTGITGSITEYNTVDRWRIENQNDASTNTSVWTMEQSTDAPEGFSSSLKCTATTADSDYGSGTSQTNVETRIEAQDVQFLKYGTANAEKLTLSFWVKSSVTGTYLAWFYQEDDNRHCTRTYTVNSANTWEQKTVTINGDTTGVIDNNNGLGLIVRWLLATGTGFQGGTAPDGSWAAYNATDTYVGQAVNVASTVNNSFAITGVQLEVGDVATAFEHRSHGDELARCQRYFQLLQHSSGVGLGTTVIARCTWPLKVTMRANMTIAAVGTPGWFHGTAGATFSALGSNYSIPEMAQMDVTVTGAGGSSVPHFSDSGGTSYFTASAEL